MRVIPISASLDLDLIRRIRNWFAIQSQIDFVIAFVIWIICHIVRSIAIVLNFGGNFRAIGASNFDLKWIAAFINVVSVIISSLDHKVRWSVIVSAVLNTWAVNQAFGSISSS